MKPIYLIPFLFLMLTFSNCKGQEKSSPIAKKDIKEKDVKPSSKSDPYFNGTTSFTQKSGPSSITRNVMEDRNGNIWLATWEGIMKYDGKEFTNYTNKEGLERVRVFSILEDSNGNLFFGTIGAGMYVYDGKTFTNYSKKDGLPNDAILDFYEDKSGEIVILTGNGISFYDGKTFTNYLPEGHHEKDEFNTIIKNKDGKFWIGTRGSAYQFDGKNFTKILRPDGHPFTNVRCMIRDKNDNIWMGGNDGLWMFDNKEFKKIDPLFIGYIFEDSKGNVWTSAPVDGFMPTWGLRKYGTASIKKNIFEPTLIEPDMGMLFDITEDTFGNIWFGSVEGVGKYNGMTVVYFTDKLKK